MSRHVPLMFRDPFFRDFWGDRGEGRVREYPLDSPTKLFDQHFGTGLWPEETPSGSSSLYLRSRRGPKERSGVSALVPAADKFTISLEVPQFTPEELKVRITSGNVLEIEGRHEERVDEHGSVFRHFIRKYTLPEDALVDLINSSLSPDGVLSIEAPRKQPEPPKPAQREIPIAKNQPQPQPTE